MISSVDFSMFSLAIEASETSGDKSTKVGCVLVDGQDVVLARASNDIPINIKDIPERRERPEKYFWTEHAERAAIYSAARSGVSLDGATAYVTWYPCMDCARALVSVGVQRIVCEAVGLDHPKYGEEFKRTAVLLNEADVVVEFINEVAA